MKKILFFMMAMLPLMFSGCSDDDEDKKKDELKFVQLQITSEDNTTPNGNAYIFKVSGYDLESDEPLSWAINYTPVLHYTFNGESEVMVPISKYGKLYHGDLVLNKKDGYSVYSFFWDELSSIYGQPKAGDEYLIFIELRNGTYAKVSKRFVIERNSVIKVRIPTCKDVSKFVDAEWSISDYR